MSPTRDAIRAQVLQIAASELALAPDLLASLTDDTDLGEHLDSIQRLSLVVGIEDHFELCFEAEDDDQAVTLGDVIAIVQDRRQSP